MATRKQDQELESFTIRVPSWLKNQLEKLKGLQAGVTTTSDAARYALERGMDIVNPENDGRELYALFSDEQSALQQVAAKCNKNGSFFSRAELTLVAYLASQAYSLTKLGLVDPKLLSSNLQAFGEFIKLRNSIYGTPEAIGHREKYYMGNLGGIYGESILEKNNNAISQISSLANQGFSQFASRNLEVALRDEPPIPLDQLNNALKPYIPSLIKLALRGFLLLKNKPAIPENLEFNTFQRRSPSYVKNGRVAVSPNLMLDNISAALIFDRNDVIISINSYFELTEFYMLVNSIKKEEHLSCNRFKLIAPNSFHSQYLLHISGVQIALEDEDFESLKTALTDVMEQEAVALECERLSWRFGAL